MYHEAIVYYANDLKWVTLRKVAVDVLSFEVNVAER